MPFCAVTTYGEGGPTNRVRAFGYSRPNNHPAALSDRMHRVIAVGDWVYRRMCSFARTSAPLSRTSLATRTRVPTSATSGYLVEVRWDCGDRPSVQLHVVEVAAQAEAAKEHQTPSEVSVPVTPRPRTA